MKSQNPLWDLLFINCHLATCDQNIPSPYGAIQQGAIGISGKKIVWIGKEIDLPAPPQTLAKKTIDLQQRWITPGLIDCHTHLVYAGNRAQEFEQRLLGKSYAEIAASGGGILSTIKATRQASAEDLYQQSAQRLNFLLAEGVTTIEIKSGYGGDFATEIKCLRVAQQLGRDFPITVKTTYLGAHVIPPEYKSNPDFYIDFVVNEVLPHIHQEKLADAVDGFCETIAFNPNQISRFFQAAKTLQFSIKLHAEQLTSLGGAELAAQFGALSVDHLEHLSTQGIAAMAAHNTTAVLLPGAFYFLREKTKPPVDQLRQAGIPIAIATDANPGTSPITSLLLIGNMACTLFNLSPEEALYGMTCNAAKALGIENICGSLTEGKLADLAIWDISTPVELIYNLGQNYNFAVVKAGQIVKGNLHE